MLAGRRRPLAAGERDGEGTGEGEGAEAKEEERWRSASRLLAFSSKESSSATLRPHSSSSIMIG